MSQEWNPSTQLPVSSPSHLSTLLPSANLLPFNPTTGAGCLRDKGRTRERKSAHWARVLSAPKEAKRDAGPSADTPWSREPARALCQGESKKTSGSRVQSQACRAVCKDAGKPKEEGRGNPSHWLQSPDAEPVEAQGTADGLRETEELTAFELHLVYIKVVKVFMSKHQSFLYQKEASLHSLFQSWGLGRCAGVHVLPFSLQPRCTLFFLSLISSVFLHWLFHINFKLIPFFSASGKKGFPKFWLSYKW